MTVVAVWFALSATGWAIENPAIRRPVGSGRVPQSVRSGLIRSPSPIDRSSNLVITGNVAGGRHFRGVVPYSAVTDFGVPTGTSSLDSFLRRSIDPGDLEPYTGRLRPYYSETQTVTRVIPGRRGSVILPRADVNGQAGGGYTVGSLLDRQPASYQRPGTFGGPPRRVRPMSMTPLEMEKAISPEVSRYLQVKGLADLRPDIGVRRELKAMEEKIAELKRGLIEGDETLGPEGSQTKRGAPISRKRDAKWEREDVPEAVGLQKSAESGRSILDSGAVDDSGLGPLETRRGAGLDQLDFYEWMRQTQRDRAGVAGTGDFAGAKGDQSLGRDPISPKTAKWDPKGYEPAAGRSGAGLGPKTEEELLGLGSLDRAKKASAGAKDSPPRRVRQWRVDSASARDTFMPRTKVERATGRGDSSLMNVLRETDSLVGDRDAKGTGFGQKPRNGTQKKSQTISARARAILGEHESYASYTAERFEENIRAAEKALKEGKYYKAADAYTLALIYKRDDPLAYAGKSHALFAAGEYMSSALFLWRALEIFPEYVEFKVDLAGIIGDREKLENRVADVEQWQQRSSSAELQFLLAYIYYQTGKLSQAKEAIGAAYEKMPEAPAVITLKRAIEGGR